MWRRVDLVWTDGSGERIASIFRVEISANVSRWLHCSAGDGGDVPPKRRYTQDLHGATSQKTAFFTVTAVKTSDLT
jgi:hypothetical protein